MQAQGYLADVELAGGVVTVRGRGPGKAALGAERRDIPLRALTSVNFKAANPLVNGQMELETAEGKTVVHFRRKQGADMRALYDQILAGAPGIPERRGSAGSAHGRTAQTSQAPPPGWHDAPDRPGFWRWWDGTAWTGQYHPKDTPSAGEGPVGTPVAAWALQSTRQHIVGEQNYAAGFRRLLAKHDAGVSEYGTTIKESPAAVVAEPTNAYDPNAVAVYVQGELVGYLPRDLSFLYSPPLQDLAERGHYLGTTARVWIAPPDDARGGSVTVLLPPPEGVQSFNEPPEQPHQVLPGGSAIQVTGEDQHMDVLARYVSDRDRHLAVSLHVVEEARTERSAPYRCVEVRLDGKRVGVLTKGMSEKLADVVDFVAGRGRIPICRAVLKGSPLRAEIVLYVAKSHEITQRWMDSVREVPGASQH